MTVNQYFIQLKTFTNSYPKKKQNKNKHITLTSMKKITTSLLLFLMGFLGLASQVNAQSNAMLVPTYQKQSDMPNKITPEDKLLKQLPMVVINENGTDLALFESEMNKWMVKKPSIINQLDKAIIDLINQKQFEKLANILIEKEHYKEIALINYKGGKHE